MELTKAEKVKDVATVWGFSLGLAAGVSWLLQMLMPENYSLGKRGLLIVSFFATTFLIPLIVRAYLAPSAPEIISPKVLKFIPSGVLPLGGFVIPEIKFFMQNSMYTVVLEDSEGLEQIIGISQFLMVQNNGLIQLRVSVRTDGSERTWNSLEDGDNNLIKNIKIKVGVPPNAI